MGGPNPSGGGREDPKSLKKPTTSRPPGAPPAMNAQVPGDRKPEPHTRSPIPDHLLSKMGNDQVVKPSHYQSEDGKFQVWDIVDQFQLNYYFGDAVKYICRAGKKKRNPATQDIRKAMQYLQRWLDIQEAK